MRDGEQDSQESQSGIRIEIPYIGTISLPPHLTGPIFRYGLASLGGAAALFITAAIIDGKLPIFGKDSDKASAASPTTPSPSPSPPSAPPPPSSVPKIDSIDGSPTKVPCQAIIKGAGAAPDGWAGAIYAIDNDLQDRVRTFVGLGNADQTGHWEQQFQLSKPGHQYEIGVVLVPKQWADYLLALNPYWTNIKNPPNSITDEAQHKNVTRSSEKCPDT